MSSSLACSGSGHNLLVVLGVSFVFDDPVVLLPCNLGPEYVLNIRVHCMCVCLVCVCECVCLSCLCVCVFMNVCVCL